MNKQLNFGTRKAEVLNSLIMKITANEIDIVFIGRDLHYNNLTVKWKFLPWTH